MSLEEKIILWREALRELRSAHNMRIGSRIDEWACRRIAPLVSQWFVSTFDQEYAELNLILLEPEIYRIAGKRS